MSRAGRKRKTGKRQPNGQPFREPVYDRGCEGVRRRQELYGYSPANQNDKPDHLNTFDAIGRAWSARLLGRDPDTLRDAGRKIAAQYWRVYGFGIPDSLARFQPSGPAMAVPDPAIDRIREDALNDALDAIKGHSRAARKAFDQLVIDLNPDCGPPWLDRIIAARRNGNSGSEADTDMLRLAIIGLRLIA